METKLKKTKAASTQNVNTQEQSEIPADINEEQQENITEGVTTEDKEQNERFDEEAAAEIILSMKQDWINNFEQYLKVNVYERKYLTRKDRKIEDIEVEAANWIMEDKIAEIGENIDLWHVNVMQCNTAVTYYGGMENYGRENEEI